MRYIKQLFITLFLFVSLTVAGQDKDEQLAGQFFSNNEFDKAADLYQRLLSRNPGSAYFYENLFQCHLKLKQYEEAEKLVKRQLRRSHDNAFFKVDLGYLYKIWNKPDKAQKQYEEIIKTLPANEGLITEAANAFVKRNEKELAIESYRKGRQLLQYEFAFCTDLGNLYAETGNTPGMIDEYLNSIALNPAYQEDVQGYLQNYLQKEKDFETLKLALLARIKDNNRGEVFYEMLIWFYVQRKDFDNALVQAKALDKRFRGEGYRLINLGYLATANEKYDAAMRIFGEVVAMGPGKGHYLQAKLGLLDAGGKKVLSSQQYTYPDLKALEKQYIDFLTENGKNNFTAPSQRALARLQANYLYDYETAISNYSELSNMPGIDPHFRAECKLDLGDVYVLKGEVWEAMLLYGQVDKDFLEDPLGQEAKFRNARLSYYQGEFEWARAQLDVLKTATTQLIANNALELSLLIQDNTLDSIEDALKIFARADLCYYQNKTEEALRLLDSILNHFPRHALTDDIIFKKAQIFIKQKKYTDAVVYLKRVTDEHGSDILGDNALFALAQLYEHELNNKEEAKKLYEKFIENYPGSFFNTDARKRFRMLRGDAI